jgi:hypothetical protein
MQGAPAEQGAQAPALQNSLFPHWVPFGALPPSVQTGDPVEQAIVAWPHDPGDAQLDPMGQPTHWPLLHTAPASHSVPAVDWPSVRQFVAPLSSHAVTPMTHASGAHCMPGMHGPDDSATASSPASSPAASAASTAVSAIASTWASGATTSPETLWSVEASTLDPVEASDWPGAKSPRREVHPAPTAPVPSASTKNPQSLLLRGMKPPPADQGQYTQQASLSYESLASGKAQRPRHVGNGVGLNRKTGRREGLGVWVG